MGTLSDAVQSGSLAHAWTIADLPAAGSTTRAKLLRRALSIKLLPASSIHGMQDMPAGALDVRWCWGPPGPPLYTWLQMSVKARNLPTFSVRLSTGRRCMLYPVLGSPVRCAPAGEAWDRCSACSQAQMSACMTLSEVAVSTTLLSEALYELKAGCNWTGGAQGHLSA